MDISLPDTLRREFAPLLSTARYFGILENLIISIMGQEQHFRQDGISVHVSVCRI